MKRFLVVFIAVCLLLCSSFVAKANQGKTVAGAITDVADVVRALKVDKAIDEETGYQFGDQLVIIWCAYSEIHSLEEPNEAGAVMSSVYYETIRKDRVLIDDAIITLRDMVYHLEQSGIHSNLDERINSLRDTLDNNIVTPR